MSLRKSSSVITVPENGSSWLFRQETRPHLGNSLQKVKDQKSLSRLKNRSKKCKQLQKGIQEKHSDHKQSKSSTKQFVLRVEEDREDSLL